MAYEHRDNSGTLFTNNKKSSDKHPDWRGEIKVDGKPWEISAWVKEGRDGKFFSLAVKEPSKKGQAQTHKGMNSAGDVPSGRDDMDDEIPF